MPRKYRDWLKGYLEYTALSESPEVFHYWAGISTLAGAIKRRVWIEMGYFQWTPNFYITFVGPPGVVSKSTTISIGMDLLGEVDSVTFGPPSCTWQALAKKFEQATELVPTDPGNIEGEMEPMSCLTCAVSELGTFLNFTDDKMISVLIEWWDARKTVFEHSTATSGTIKIANPWINIISATTPTWLKANAPETFIGGGLASRTIFVYGARKRHLVAYPGLVKPREELVQQRADLIHDLKEIALAYGQMQLTPEAIVFGDAWYQELQWGARPLHLASDRFDGYLSRKQTHVHKLAMVLALSRHDHLWVELKDLQDALNIITAMEASMLHVFESVGVAPIARHVREIMSFVWTYQTQGYTVTRQRLWRHCMQIMSAQEFTEAVDAGVKADYMQVAQNGTDVYYRCLLNPNELTASGEASPAPQKH